MRESNPRLGGYEPRDLTVCPLCIVVVCPTVNRLSDLPAELLVLLTGIEPVWHLAEGF